MGTEGDAGIDDATVAGTEVSAVWIASVVSVLDAGSDWPVPERMEVTGVLPER